MGETTALEARSAVVEAAHSAAQGLLYTERIIDMAAELLTDVWTAAGRHGLPPGDVDLAGWCLTAVDRRSRARTRAAEDAHALLAALTEEFTQAGVEAFVAPGRGMVVLPRGPRTPTWGYREPPQLAVTVLTDGLRGWYLATYPAGALLGRIAAPSGREGAAAVARLAIAVNAGRRSQPWTARDVTPPTGERG
ncbi:hypothetical protein [Amycolatopsis suaedae]|uniref:Uncharacterized protein n=1 Tax=Amycolatopsis suaedae TaxID=2510978 RepID=A0A4Q7J3N1_9PSEU|nr:hypothetical protein [Amycolatopsis suaedae]RZQ61398.1 hypothetical protein EWH70_23735 [Amycolatopsis suaedae]